MKLTTEQPTAGVYTLTGGHIVSLASSSPLRVGEAPGYDDARGFVFSSSGGAVLRADGVVECLKSDGASCGVMFSGERCDRLPKGLDGEVWLYPRTGANCMCRDGGKETDLKLDWLGAATALCIGGFSGRVPIGVGSRGRGHERRDDDRCGAQR